MNIKHKYDYYGRKEPSPVFLAKPGKRLYCGLEGIDESNCDLTVRSNNTATLTFSIDKYVDGHLNKEYDYVDEYMELYCAGIWFKIMEPPSITNDGLREIKEVTAESYEIMLTQYMLKTFLINMGTEGSYEMMYRNTHDKSKFYQVKFYDPKEEKLSLLHLILAHADVPGWKIGYVDHLTPDEQNVFLPDAICNFEVENKSVYAFLTQDVAQAYKCVFEFDTVNMLINVYRVESLGKDTNVVLGFRNIQDNITTTRDDSLITQYYVEGLNGYNIEMYNFKSNIIEDLSYFTKEPYMNKTLQDKYNTWTTYRESRREEFGKLSKEYNGYLTSLNELMYRLPVDSAKNNWFGRKLEDLKSAYNDNMAIIKGLEKLYVDSNNNFDLDALKKSPDWPLYESIMNYTLPAIVAAIQAKGEKVEGFGKGNVISCVNPIVMGDDWLYIGADKATFEAVDITDTPAWGITRGIKVTGTGGVRQKNITVEKTQGYVLSCFVKGSGTFNLEFGDTGKDREVHSFNIASNTWQRVYYPFSPGSKLVDVAFTGSNFTICGMQLEMGLTPSQFGYFIQSENILKAYETDWKLYGIKELKIKIEVYENSAEELKKNGYAGEYNPLADYEEAYFTQMHQLYLDYLKLAKEATTALNERQKEYDVIKAKQDAVEAKRDQIVKEVSIENFGIIQTALPGFTVDELYIIKSLYSQAVYTNENIIVTSLDNTVDAVDKQKKLYNEAAEQLYIESHPQYIYEDSISNIYSLPEFSEFHGELQVNNFIRVGLTDKLYVKLRVIELSFNPIALDENMNIVFSNMIQYKSKRTDFASLLNDSGNGSNRNGGRVDSVNKNNSTDYIISADVIKQLFSNPLFGSILGGSTAGGSASGGNINADKIVAELVKANEGVFGKLTADTAFMKYLESKLIVSDKIVTQILQADKATIENLSATLIKANVISADVANIKQLLAGHAGVGDLTTLNLTANNVTINDAVIKDMIAARISVADLMAHTASAKQIVLVSADGTRPTIAFQDSTQQFYDNKGNVRVQIGQDGTGKFNFIVRGEDGKTAIMDEHGIHREGIPDGTIINNMIDANTISKDKMNFPIVETDANGNVSITHIYDGNEMFGVKYERFQTEVNNKFDDIANKVKEIDLYSDGQVFINDNGVISPKTIKVYGLVRGAVKIAHWYVDGVEETVGVSADKSFIMIPHTLLNKDKSSVTIKATDDSGKFYDSISLYYVYSGISGFNTTAVYLYQRSAKTPLSQTENLVYDFKTKTLTGNLVNGWLKEIPQGNDPLYVITSTASSKTDSAIVTNWSTPVVLSKDGQEGIAGLNTATIYLYQRNSHVPFAPAGDVTYDFTTKQCTGINNGWRTSIPAGTDPLYVTTATACANTNTDIIASSEWTAPIIMAKDGEDGVGIREVIEYYQVSNMKDVAPTDWVTTPPVMTPANKYLWNYEETKYSDNSISTTEKRIIGVYGEQGNTGVDGIGVRSIVNNYLATPAANNVLHTTPGWTTTVQAVSVKNKYLWNYETITYTNNEVQKTQPCIIGVYGDTGQTGANGVGISKIEEFYQVSSSNSTPPTNTWQSIPPAMTEQDKYLWNYEKITYTNGKNFISEKRVIGMFSKDGIDGKPGADGQNGIGIQNIANYYLATAAGTGVTTATTGWTETVQLVSEQKKYLWNYEKITYTDNSIHNTEPCIIGTYAKDGADGQPGLDGKDGVGVSNIEEFYQISDSNTVAPVNWVTTPPQMDPTNKYLWNYEKITYTNNTSVETAKRVIGVYGDKGQNGEDGYTVYLTNQNDIYVAATNGEIKAETQNSTQVIAYKGTKQIPVTIGDIAAVPGMNITKVKDTITFTALIGGLLPAKGDVSIPVTADNKLFGLTYSFVKVADTSGELDAVKTTITEIQSTVDNQGLEIQNKISQKTYDADKKVIDELTSQHTQKLGLIEQSVSSMNTDFSGKIQDNTTKITQTADKLNLIATGGDGTSSLTLTQGFIDLMSDKISFQATEVNVDAILNIINTRDDKSGKTQINGGAIQTDTINAMLVRAGALQSANYKQKFINIDGFSEAGMKINMTDGSIESVCFAIDKDGNAKFKGSGEFSGKITASSGHIGGINGFIIDAGKLYSGKDTFSSTNPGVYVGIDGIALGGTQDSLTGVKGKFTVDQYGHMIATSGEFSGAIKASTFDTTSNKFYVLEDGTMHATGGTIGGFTIANNAIYNGITSLDSLKSGVYLGNDGISLGGGKFKVTSGGKLTATDANITGTITATDGSFTGTIHANSGEFKGAVHATSLTLGTGVTIDYGNISNPPDIPSVERFISKDGIIGFAPSENSTGFKVSSDGLLEASNAIIYGKIYASGGTIGGFSIANSLDDNAHAYAYTLYRQVKNVYENGKYYDYQAGIKGGSSANDSTSATEAAFYVRKKETSSPNWGTNYSKNVFYVRNDGKLYAENIEIGNYLYMKDTSYNKRIKTMFTDMGSAYYGWIVSDNPKVSYEVGDTMIECGDTGISFYYKNSNPLIINRYNKEFSIYPSVYPDETVTLGTKEDPFNCLYVKSISLNGESVNNWKDIGNIGGGTISPYNIGKGLVLTKNPSPNTLRVQLAGEKHDNVGNIIGYESTLGGIKFNSNGNLMINPDYLNYWGNQKYIQKGVFKPQDINWVNGDSKVVDKKGFGHIHTIIMNDPAQNPTLRNKRAVALTNGDLPALIPFSFSSYTNPDNLGLTYGGTTDLGSTSYPWNALYVDHIYLNGNEITGSGGGSSITSANVTSTTTLPTDYWGNVQNATASVTLNGSTLQFKFGIPQGEKGESGPKGATGPPGPKGDASDRLVYGSASSVVLQKLIESGKTNYRLIPSGGDEGVGIGNAANPFASVYANYVRYKKLSADLSDKYYKTDIKEYSKKIEDIYMELKPISFKFRNLEQDDAHDRTHYGFISQEVEEIILKHGLTSMDCAFLAKTELDKPNHVGSKIEYGLYYKEFISLNTHMTQKAHHRIDDLEKQNQELKSTLLQLQGEISILKQKLGGI